ncbi:uncharacterized protein K452DRAFT_285184 [Aplosporella prunicola CBS 121167]|uniref:Rhodopsin domain-containing protein n=1 Tax=Aplosporella prunicola CBS 121167 TaxID=1176127 RepID=A0A6A6BN46_9PEZI|nr:uncharacterized protein K452DRAFT_285184 [Aplosporella prunicola CBS 121167]KAF2143981.1 hypothetical protein K452DRAFT_285184 [Aplosporella prunicola CBS 121167]
MTPKGQAALGLTLCFIILSSLVVAMRLFTRYRILRNAGPDDWLVVVAHLCNVALTVTICGQVHYGMGHHTSELSRAYLTGTMQYFYASLPAYYLSLTFTKLSLLLQCFRIFTSADFGMRLASWILMGLVVSIGIYTVLADILICMPVKKFWDDSVAGYCVNEEALWLTNAAFNILTDMAIFLLPIKRVAGLQLAPNKKRLLIVVFGTGFL